ncbi:hypothetical protein [Phenylobacterium sp. 58.2.17]|uniref:hypothetical protein n=1 Tax=Phenylobacterium sp. 58.2.17 TaxID=2969306 RepID=UPI002264B6A5|nr:hypothetical protein [Phenylobacterium sp. 58.2.17]MCX7586539.1 hypothetical protein [Phenylobacterium sp. 58.2.17]
MSKQFDFKAAKGPFEATWPVKVNVPQDDGKIEVQEFVARFRLIRDEDFEELKKNPDLDQKGLQRVYFVGLAGGRDAEWNEELREDLLGTPWVRAALTTAYTEFSQGIAAKN